MKTYNLEEVKKIYTETLTDIEQDLIHLVKHGKEPEKAVAKLQVFDLISNGITAKLRDIDSLIQRI